MIVKIKDRYGNVEETEVEYMKYLGQGYAGEVKLVETSKYGLVAEKRFTPKKSLLFYFFGRDDYRKNYYAIEAALHRRIVIKLLAKFWRQQDSKFKVSLSEALYIRWDIENKSWILGTEEIDGRLPKLNKVDRKFFQRIFSKEKYIRGEFDLLTGQMKRLTEKMRQIGFIGSLQQIAAKKLFPNQSTNFLVQDLFQDIDGEIQITGIDLEAAFPSYQAFIIDAWKRGKCFLYDWDIDQQKLREYIKSEKEKISKALSEDEMKQFLHSYKEFIFCTEKWKNGEVEPEYVRELKKPVKKDIMIIMPKKVVEQVEEKEKPVILDRLKQRIGRFLEKAKKIRKLNISDCLDCLEWKTRNFLESNLDRLEPRMEKQEVVAVRKELKSVNYLKEYFAIQGAHLLLKVHIPPFGGIIGAVGIFLYTGSVIAGLSILFASAILRTLATLGILFLMKAIGRKIPPCSVILTVGLIPEIGNYAVPMQIHKEFPSLSEFTLRLPWLKFSQKLLGEGTMIEDMSLRIGDLLISFIYIFEILSDTLSEAVEIVKIKKI